MLNNDLLEELYKGLTLERKKELLRLLFGESNQSMAYFRRSKDIMLSKAETISDFFNIPIDTLRKDCRYNYDHRTMKIFPKEAKQQLKGESGQQDKIDVERLVLRNKFLEDTIKLREERIELLLEKIALYQEKYENQA